MALILYGKPVAASIYADTRNTARALIAKGVTPTLSIFRAGPSPDALAYERGIASACERALVSVKRFDFDEKVSQDTLAAAVDAASRNDGIHGIIIMRPLPAHIDEAAVLRAIAPRKDVDGATEQSLSTVFSGSGEGYAPCTAEAVVRMCDFYDIPIEGKRAVIVGRSLVVGRPASMLLLARNATVTLCHTKTENLAEICREADILVAAAGRARLLGADCVRDGQSVIDCGVNAASEGGLCGDLAFEEAQGLVDAISPVPGGVGAVTSALLAEHVVASCARLEAYV